MPKIAKPSKPTPHANADRWNRYMLKGHQMANEGAKRCCETVGCPRCRSAKGWPCASETGNVSSTPHAARWEAYRAALDEASDTGRA